MDLIYKVRKIIKKENLINEGDCILTCVSGGIDSTAMLHVLLEISKKMAFRLGVCHLNHQLRGEESLRDERFVEKLADKFSLPFYSKRANVKAFAKRHKLSIQHAGRDMRYDFFESTASQHGFNKIAVAHNLDDRVETFLLRMIKGTGIRGLSSIPVERGRIIRPFHDVYRSGIEDYVKNNSIQYVKDSSNEKITYERNYIRKRIIPHMEKINPLFREKLILLLQDIMAMNDAYDAKAEDFFEREKKIDGEDISFEIDALKEADEEVRFRVIVGTFEQIKPGLVPFREHMRLVNKVLMSEKPNLMLTMPSGIKVKRAYNRLFFTKRQALPKITGTFPLKLGKNRLGPFNVTVHISLLNKSKDMQFPADKNIACIDGGKIKDLSVRAFLEGDRFFPLGMKNSVKLKDFFISKKIPREQRRSIPILISGSDIVWVMGHRIDERFKVAGETTKILKVMIVPERDES